MTTRTVVNGRIKSTRLGVEDHGILTSMVYIEDGHGQQGFGGWSFDGAGAGKFAALYIRGLLEAVGVESWEQLTGAVLRIERDGPMGRIVRVGHIIDDKWFDPQAVADKCKAAP